MLPAPLLDISAWIEPHRDEYYYRLLRALIRATRLHALRELYRARVTTARVSSLLPQLVDALFVVPAMTINRAAQLLGVSHRGASQTVARLVGAGLLTEVEPAGRTRLFVAREIIAVASGEQMEVSDDAAGAG